MKPKPVWIAVILLTVVSAYLKQKIDDNRRRALEAERALLAASMADPPSSAAPPATIPATRSRSDLGWVDALQKQGWPRAAALAYCGQNAAYLESVTAPNARSALLARLGELIRLPSQIAVFRQVEETPELASLLAWVSDPEKCFQAWSVSSPGQRLVLMNVLLIQRDPDRAAEFARGWRLHGGAVTDTWRRGLIGTEALLIRPESTDPVEQHFDRWIDDVAREAANESEFELASRILLLIDEGPALRIQLRDPEFRKAFDSRWQKLLQIKEKTACPMGQVLRHPQIWNLLGRPDGVELATTYGTTIADMLFGADAYPSDTQERVVRLLKSRMVVAFEALRRTDLRSDNRFKGNFIGLLRRARVSDLVLLKIFDDLQRSDKGPGPVLSRLSALSDLEISDLYREKVDMASWDDHLPGYLKVARRWISGVPLDDQDINKAVVDAILDSAATITRIGSVMAQVPSDPADSVFEGMKDGIHNGLDAKTKREIEDQKKRFERIIQPVLNSDSKKYARQGLDRIRDEGDKRIETSRKLLAALVAFQQPERRDDHTALTSLVLFASVSESPASRDLASTFRDTGTQIRLNADGRLYLASAEDVATPYSAFKKDEWGRRASRRWLELALRDRP